MICGIDGKYDVDMDNKLTYLNAEIRPWGASTNKWAQAAYIAAGVGYVDNQYDMRLQASVMMVERSVDGGANGAN
jgi:hypothetical protein